MNVKNIGDFTILKKIGEGSLGTVFLAEHKFVKKTFVLKVLPEELAADNQFITRFEKEVALVAGLDHPHIVLTHSASFAEGFYYLVTECVLGEDFEMMNLAKYLEKRKKPLSEEEIMQILGQVASALDYAHQEFETPILHLSLKVNNIVIAEKAGGLHVQLSDFGLANVVGAGYLLSRMYNALAETLGARADSPSAISTLQRSFLQSYVFLAPEQKVVSESTKVTFKADIYAFGVLAYYLLMGEFPEGAFTPPSEKRPSSPYSWDKFCTLLLQPHPEKRPNSLQEALQVLRSPKENKVAIKKTESVDLSEILDKKITSKASQAIEQEALQTVSSYAAQELAPVLRPQEIMRPEFDSDPGAIFQRDAAVGKYQRQEVETKVIEPVLTEMIVIKGGTFFRGSQQGARDEMPRHQVTISDYALDVHPVTNEQFVLFLEAMGGEKDANNLDMIRLRDSRIKRSGGKLSIESGYAKHPVVGVAWYGAVAYAKWVGKRLPTEAEWEIAAFGGLSDSIYPSGSTIERSEANFFSSDTTTVGSYPPNGYGLYDVAGNVYEWCQDWYDYHYYDVSVQEPENPKGPLQGVYRVLRGGCWKSLKEDLRCAHRHRNNPGTMNGTYGFRCAADVSPR
ncbi:MAG: SUMF1/EgtB/PvdO family nonheme iron enzyme [Chlamydiae bacterium]|nr:SUMF1/EgtB/PvdO family nonheme iron enzyme [Chlamydiota bacterium]